MGIPPESAGGNQFKVARPSPTLAWKLTIDAGIFAGITVVADAMPVPICVTAETRKLTCMPLVRPPMVTEVPVMI
ncbi:unannotated protein [freshwater metagenome]|uniref:Unannotated protein n=1 Tax=freshwater metagenome TaxID=449393 RepID=A0A6J7BIK0_9ZZZZ